jgi:hypothetical protein
MQKEKKTQMPNQSPYQTKEQSGILYVPPVYLLLKTGAFVGKHRTREVRAGCYVSAGLILLMTRVEPGWTVAELMSVGALEFQVVCSLQIGGECVERHDIESG